MSAEKVLRADDVQILKAGGVGVGAFEAAEARFLQSLDLAREQKAAFWELRAAKPRHIWRDNVM